MKYQGCFKDDENNRMLDVKMTKMPGKNSNEKCVEYCLGEETQYASMQYGIECW